MSDRESYFPPSASIEDINNSLYTDHMRIEAIEGAEDVFNDLTNPMYIEEEDSSEPPF
jgi:hypothetical protein